MNPIFEDHFDVGVVPNPAYWDRYSGLGNGGVGTRHPRLVTLGGDSTAHIEVRGATTESGGMSFTGPSARPLIDGPMADGYYCEVRLRVERHPGVSPCFLLWPSTSRWPDDHEYDVYEDLSGERLTYTATSHWGGPNGGQDTFQFARVKVLLPTPGTDWHIYAVEWSAGSHVLYEVDGREVLRQVSPSLVASVRHFIALQYDILAGGAVGDSTMYIDWVRIYDTHPRPTLRITPPTSARSATRRRR